MEIKAIILDIDGTLLSSKKVILPKTKEILIKAQEKGIKLILASGRPLSGMVPLIKELKMDEYEGFFVSFNGALSTNCLTQETLFNQPLSIQTAQEILEHMKKFDVKPMINKGEYMYVNNVYDNILNLPTGDMNVIEYESRGGNFKLCEIADLAAFADFKLNKILIAGNPQYLQENYQAMSAPFIGKVNAMFTAPIYYEFTDLGVDKAKALDVIAKKLAVKPENMIAFGDGQNDRSIIEYAGMGVAMGNAIDEVKEIADAITLSNDEDGIAVTLEKLL